MHKGALKMNIAVYDRLCVFRCEYIDKIIKESEFDGIPIIDGGMLVIYNPSYNDIVELASWETTCTLI